MKEKNNITNTEYKHFSEIMEKLRLLVFVYKTLPKTDLSTKVLALVTRRGISTNSYKIYVSEFCSGHAFLIHEAGHIIFQHLRYENMLHQQVQNRLLGAWDSFSKYIKINAHKPDDLLNTKNNLVHLLCNYAMDMEVNSKLFDADEKEKFIEDMSRAEYKRLKYIYYNKLPGYGNVKKILDRFVFKRQFRDPKTPLIKPIFPEDFGFPRGLSWLKYIDLIIMHPKEVMEQVLENIKMTQPTIISKDEKIPSSVISQISQATDTSEVIIQEVQEFEKEHTQSSHAKSRTQNFTVHKLGPEVQNFITQRSIDEYKGLRTDYLYLSNRGKSQGLLRGKSVDHADYCPANIHIIVDTSGSVPQKQLAKLLSLFSDIRNYIGQQSKVIFWDSDLQRVDNLYTGIKNIPLGYSTDIAPAIEYTAKRFCQPGDKIFIISDFYDNLKEWQKVIKKLPYQCFGIQWSFNKNFIKENKIFPESFYKDVETLFVNFDYE